MMKVVKRARRLDGVLTWDLLIVGRERITADLYPRAVAAGFSPIGIGKGEQNRESCDEGNTG